jgi:hypothetical protein
VMITTFVAPILLRWLLPPLPKEPAPPRGIEELVGGEDPETAAARRPQEEVRP